MSYTIITCPVCNTEHKVSKYYLDVNKNVSKADLAKQLCTCVNKVNIPSSLDVDSYLSRLSKIIKEKKEKDKKKITGSMVKYDQKQYFC